MLLSIEQRAVIVLILKLLMVLIIVTIGEIIIGGLLTTYYRNKRVKKTPEKLLEEMKRLSNIDFASVTEADTSKALGRVVELNILIISLLYFIAYLV